MYMGFEGKHCVETFCLVVDMQVSAASLWLCVAAPAGMVAIKVFINEEEQVRLAVFDLLFSPTWRLKKE